MSTVTVSDVTRKPAQELEQIFKDHYQFVYRTAYSVTGNEADAEDILQTIFVGLLRREFPPDLKSNPKAYLYRAAFNLALNTLRMRKRHPSIDNVDTLATTAYPSDSAARNDELDQQLSQAIAQLHPGSAQIVILRYVHNNSIAEIAKLLGTTRSTVAVSLFRSRARLKRLIRASQETGERS
jgi:RNA polymerase sigma-70 factor (ECF subfamily)